MDKGRVNQTIVKLKQTQKLRNRLFRGDDWYHGLIHQVHEKITPQNMNEIRDILHKRGSKDSQDKKFKILSDHINRQFQMRKEMETATMDSLNEAILSLQATNNLSEEVITFLKDTNNYDITRLITKKNVIEKDLFDALFRFFINYSALKAIDSNGNTTFAGQLARKIRTLQQDRRAGFNPQQATIARQLGWNGGDVHQLRQQQKEAINKTFRRKALDNHPDKGGDPQVFKKYNKVRDVLTNTHPGKN